MWKFAIGGGKFKQVLLTAKNASAIKVKFKYSETSEHPCNKPRFEGGLVSIGSGAYLADLEIMTTMLACPQAAQTLSAESEEFTIPANYSNFVNVRLILPDDMELQAEAVPQTK